MCVHSLRTDFLGSGTVSTGGVWTYEGFNTNVDGPFTSNAATPPAALVGAVPLVLVSDNPSVDWNGADDGYYLFTYDLGSCGGEAELKVKVNDSCFTASITINVHTNQGDINLNTIASNGLGCKLSPGYWNFLSGETTAFNPANGKFKPDVAGVGTTVVQYITAPDCVDCISTITINVYDCTSNDLCYFYGDFSETNEQADLDNSSILYFNVGGINQLPTPIVGLGPKSVITYGAAPYLTNFVDTLNTINLDCFNFYYATFTLAPETRQKWFRMCYPQNVDWEFKVFSSGGAGGGTYWLYTPTEVSYSYDDITYFTLNAAGFYNVTAATTTGIETCITVASCE